jgi:hypothetical protein
MNTGRTKLKFNRHELAGSFGDIGTDLPLIIALIASAKLDFASVFIMFGVMQILSGLIYNLPMPMQPLKAMAVIVITQKLSAHTFYAGGIAIGILMLLITIFGFLPKLQKSIPHHVVRGIQIGLAIMLGKLALLKYIPAQGGIGIFIAFLSLIIILFLKNHKRYPASLVIIVLGLSYSFLNIFDSIDSMTVLEFNLPVFQIIEFENLWSGLILLAIPQLPLSLTNSVIATHQTISDLYPQRKIDINKIGLTYALTNLITPLFGGIPLCHGCGGLVGHHFFGGRTGGSVIYYGLFFLVTGIFFADIGAKLISMFPSAILGAILLVEALALLFITKDIIVTKPKFIIAIIVALIAAFIPQGFLIGIIVGISLTFLYKKRNNDT